MDQSSIHFEFRGNGYCRSLSTQSYSDWRIIIMVSFLITKHRLSFERRCKSTAVLGDTKGRLSRFLSRMYFLWKKVQFYCFKRRKAVRKLLSSIDSQPIRRLNCIFSHKAVTLPPTSVK